MILHKIKINSPFPMDYFSNECANPKRVIFLLHGYGESGKKIFNRLIDFLPKDALVIAPNGPFPLPEKLEDGYKVSYAWYFYNKFTGEFLIDYDFPSELLKNLWLELNLKLPLTVIGYSQGGYLAPFVGEKIVDTNQVIGVNCRFRYDRLKNLKFKLYGIHGKNDDTVDPIMAFESFEVLKRKGISGDFYTLENEGHRLTNPFKEKIQKLLMV